MQWEVCHAACVWIHLEGVPKNFQNSCTPCVWRFIFWSFVTETKQGQAPLSHVNGNISPTALKFGNDFVLLVHFWDTLYTLWNHDNYWVINLSTGGVHLWGGEEEEEQHHEQHWNLFAGSNICVRGYIFWKIKYCKGGYLVNCDPPSCDLSWRHC